MHDKNKTYKDHLEKLQAWLKTADAQISFIQSQPIRSQPADLQHQLEAVKAFSAVAIAENKVLEELKVRLGIQHDIITDRLDKS